MHVFGWHHRSVELKTLKGGFPLGLRQIIYVDRPLLPTLLENLRASLQPTLYAAISTVPSLSMFKQIIDSRPSVREAFNSSGPQAFTGTVFIPDNEVSSMYMTKPACPQASAKARSSHKDFSKGLLVAKQRGVENARL